MKWVRKEPKKDGSYFTFVLETESLGILIRNGGKWYARLKQGIVEVPSVQGIDFFCKFVRPKI